MTAAAGTGIGFATAKRCAEEGATVVISDHHERRLGEAAEQLAEVAGTAPATVVCDVTDQAQVDAMFAAAIEATGGIDVLVNNAGLGGTATLVDMTDEQWHRVLDVTLTRHVPLHAGRAAAHDAAGSRRDREQRVGARLAGAGRAGALRRGQGRRDGAHPASPRSRPRRPACA